MLIKKTKNLLTVFLILNLILVSLYVLLSMEIGKNIEKISNLSNDLSLQLAKEKQLRSFKSVAEDTLLNRAKLNSYLVANDGEVSFINKIEELINISGAETSISTVSVEAYNQDAVMNEYIEVLRLKLNTAGSWSENIYLLNLLESMPYRISITDLSLDAVTNSDGKNEGWEGIISLKVLKSKNESSEL